MIELCMFYAKIVNEIRDADKGKKMKCFQYSDISVIKTDKEII